MQVARAGDVDRLLDLRGRPLRGAPVQHLALADQGIHRLHGLGDRGVRIRAMAVIKIQVLHPQALERGVAGVGHVLARQAVLGRTRVVDRTEEHLAGDAEAVAWEAQVGDHIPHHLLGATAGIALGVVEEVDPGIPGGGDQLAGLVAANLIAEGHPGPEGQGRELQAGGAKTAIEHVVLLLRARDRAGSIPVSVEGGAQRAQAGHPDLTAHDTAHENRTMPCRYRPDHDRSARGRCFSLPRPCRCSRLPVFRGAPREVSWSKVWAGLASACSGWQC